MYEHEQVNMIKRVLFNIRSSNGQFVLASGSDDGAWRENMTHTDSDPCPARSVYASNH